jgi:hypothetical protein
VLHEKHKSLVHAVLVELAGCRCFCGSMKREKTTFCTRCYHKLPLLMRNSLYAHVGSGYLENYAAARKFLAEYKPPTRPARQQEIAA